MAESQEVKITSNDDLNQKIVLERIKKGEYICVNREVIGRTGKFYRVLQDIYDKKDIRITSYYHCRVCNDVVWYPVQKGSSPLNRHADACDPLPSNDTKPSKNDDNTMPEDDEQSVDVVPEVNQNQKRTGIFTENSHEQFQFVSTRFDLIL